MRGRPRGSWTSSQYRWSPASRGCRAACGDLPVETPRVELVRRWLRAFGPGTVADLRWWTGWTGGQVKQALAAVRPVEVDLRRRDRARAARRRRRGAAGRAVGRAAPGPRSDPDGLVRAAWYLGAHGRGCSTGPATSGPACGATGGSSVAGPSARTARSWSGCSKTSAARRPRRRCRGRSGWPGGSAAAGHPTLPYPAGARAVGDLSGPMRSRAVGGPGRRGARMRHDAARWQPSRSSLTKRFGAVDAVNDLTFDVQAGRVTGFLGPNGAGKRTTLRTLLGLIRPSAGSATFDGARYEELDAPSTTSARCSRTPRSIPAARRATTCGCSPRRRPAARARGRRCSSASGSSGAADRRVKGYSIGMRQRLAIAAALLGDPEVLILDEPPTASTRRASAGCASSCAAGGAGGRCSCRATCSPRSRRSSTTCVVVARPAARRGPFERSSAAPRRRPSARRTPAARRRAAGARVRGRPRTARWSSRRATRRGRAGRSRGRGSCWSSPRARSLEEAFFALTGGGDGRCDAPRCAARS